MRQPADWRSTITSSATSGRPDRIGRACRICRRGTQKGPGHRLFLHPHRREAERFAEINTTLLDIQRAFRGGHAFDSTRLPEQVYCDNPTAPPKTLPPVCSGGFILVRGHVTEVFRSAGVGDEELRPVALVDRDLETMLGVTFSALAPQGGLATLELDRVPVQRVWDGIGAFESPNDVALEVDGDGTVLRARPGLAADRPVRNDPSLWLTLFVSEAVGRAS